MGCATGDLVGEWERLNKYAVGIEGDKSCIEYKVCSDIVIHDLRKTMINTIVFDLCTCFEVAEHIEPEYASIFVDNLTNWSDQVLVSAAPPGQGGLYHVNCQKLEYWTGLFQKRGYAFDEKTTIAIKEGMHPWRKRDGIRAFYNNLAYFVRRK